MNDVTRRTRIFYGLGSVAEGVKDTAFNVFLLFYYNNVLGLPGSLAGLAIFLALCVDAVADPLIGSLSDKTRSRLGRRHPYMYAAVLPLPFLFWAVFDPPAAARAEPMALFAWLAGASIALRLCLSVYAVPSNALAAEMTRRYDERTEIIGVRFLFGWTAGLLAAFAGFIVFFGPQPGGADGRLVADAYVRFALFCGVVAAAGVFLCAHGTRVLIPGLRQPAGSQQGAGRFWRELRDVMANPSFRALFGGAVFSAASWGYINTSDYYMNTYFWGLSSGQTGVLTLSMFVSIAVAFAFAPFASRRWDKKQAAIALAVFAIAFGPAPILARYLGLTPPAGSGALLAVLFVHHLVLIACTISVSILTASMITDVTDQGEMLHGERREGLYAAVMVFAVKASSGIGGLLSGVTLDLVKFPRQVGIGEVPEDSVDALGYLVGPGIMLMFIASTVCLAFYRISRDEHRRIVERLQARAP